MKGYFADKRGLGRPQILQIFAEAANTNKKFSPVLKLKCPLSID